MRCAVAVGIISILLCRAPQAAADQQDQTARGWTPRIAIGGGIVSHESDGTVSSSVRPSADSTNERVNGPLVTGELELMTPGLVRLPGRPRFFASVGVSADLGQAKDIAREGAPDEFTPDPTPGLRPDTVGGQGSATRVENAGLILQANAGVSFTVEVGERRLELKPSFAYARWEREIEGVVHHVEAIDASGFGPPFRFIAIRETVDETFHAIGPGFDLDYHTGRLGPFDSSIFIGFRALHLLGDDDVSFSGAYSDALGDATASWRYEPERWHYLGRAGLALRWSPD